MVESEVKWENNKITCLLPITAPTSKFRVKRNDQPLATRQNILRDNDLLEWQISYRSAEWKLIELGKMLELGVQNKIFTKSELRDLEREINKIQATFAETFDIKMKITDETFQGFKIIYKESPVLIKESDEDCCIEIELKHKQRAVGFQPMIYLLIPLKNVSPIRVGGKLAGRTANVKEMVKWTPSKKIIKELVTGFAIASEKHRTDMNKIIRTFLH